MRDLRMSNSAYAHAQLTENKGYVNIVIGAHPDDRCASAFSKKSLGELIAKLQAIHDEMPTREQTT